MFLSNSFITRWASSVLPVVFPVVSERSLIIPFAFDPDFPKMSIIRRTLSIPSGIAAKALANV